MTEQVIRERLILCGIKRTFLTAQNDRLRRETERALKEARRLGSPSLPITEAAQLAGVSRSVAYSKYLGGQEGDDAGAGNNDGPAVADRVEQGQRGQVREG
jgi:hypothetical protein